MDSGALGTRAALAERLLGTLPGADDRGTLARALVEALVRTGAARGAELVQHPDGDRTGPTLVLARTGELDDAVTLPLAGSEELLLAVGRPAVPQELLEVVAAAAATHVRRIDELRQLHDAACSDHLTGLRNRRAFDEALIGALARLDRGLVAPVGLVLVDIDDLKAVNDGAGHAAGDNVLRTVARVLRDAARRGDVAARIGGDEFALVLPGGDVEGALALVDRLRDEFVAARLPVTASFGVAVATTAGTSASALLRDADDALYRAKHAGKDRVAQAGG